MVIKLDRGYVVGCIGMQSKAHIWRLLMWEGRALTQLSWDSRELRWRSSLGFVFTYFFEHIAQVGWYVLLGSNPTGSRECVLGYMLVF